MLVNFSQQHPVTHCHCCWCKWNLAVWILLLLLSILSQRPKDSQTLLPLSIKTASYSFLSLIAGQSHFHWSITEMKCDVGSVSEVCAVLKHWFIKCVKLFLWLLKISLSLWFFLAQWDLLFWFSLKTLLYLVDVRIIINKIMYQLWL